MRTFRSIRSILAASLACSLSLAALAAGEAAADPYAGAKRPQGARLPFGNINFNGENIWTGDAGCSTTNMLSFCMNSYGLKPNEEGKGANAWDAGKPEGRLGHIQKPRVGEHPGHGFFQGDNGECAALWRSGIAQWKPNLKAGQISVWLKFGGSMVTSAEWKDGVFSGTCHTIFCGPPSAPAATMHFAVRFPRQPDEVQRIERKFYDGRSQSYKAVSIDDQTNAAHTVDSGFRFPIGGANPTIGFKLGTSWTSQAQALKNLDAEIPGWDLAEVKAIGRRAWDGCLGRVEIEAPDWLKRHLYTNLMDAVLHPDVFNDVDGQFCGFDIKPHQGKIDADTDMAFGPLGVVDGKTVPVRGNRYHHFSSWDTKYAQQPLIALLWPEVGADIAQSFLDQARTGLGGFARWSIGQREFGTMEGDPSSIMIASTWSLGARTFEVEAALDTMIRSATEPGLECQPGFLSRPGLGRYLVQGQARNDPKFDRLGKPFKVWGNASKESGGTSGTGGRSQSQTLDYAIADFATSRMAAAHGRKDIADRLMRQAQHWQAIMDPATKMFIGQDGGSYAESNGRAAQFMVPHNWPKLAELMGGIDKALEHWNAHPPHLHNEDNHYAPWALNWLDRPWECQLYHRKAFLTQFCRPTTLGNFEKWTWKWPEPFEWSKLGQKIPGSNDLGAMTAMGFWMAVGIFPVQPGECGFSVGSPIIPKIVLKRGRLGSLTVIAKNADPLNAYVQSLTVNGKPWNSSWIPGELLPFGKDHVLEFTMGAEPNQQWGLDPKPPSWDAEPWYKAQKTSAK